MLNNQYIILKLILLSPIKIFLYGIILISFLILIAPVKILYLGTLYSWSFLLISILSIFLGLLLGMKKLQIINKQIRIKIKIKILKKVFILASLLAFFGVILRIYDKYIIRGASLYADMMTNRDVLLESGTNIFSVISSFFYPMILLLPFLYIILSKTNLNKKRYLFITITLSLFPVVDALLLGARSIIFVFIFFNIFYLLSFTKIKFKIKSIFILLSFLVLFFIFNGYIFDERANLIHINPILSTQKSVYALFIPLDDNYVNFLTSIKGSYFYYFMLGLVNFIQYMVHGLFELLYLVDNFDTENLYYGQQNFAVIIKFIYKLLGISFSFSENQIFLARTGIYNTLLGPIYYDFAYAGIIFTFILSFFIGRIYNKLHNGNIFLYPLYTYFLSLIFFSLIVNMITFANGIYTFVAFLLFYFVSKSLWKKGVNK